MLKCSACYIEVQLVKIVVVVVVVELKCMENGMDRELCCVSVSSECSAVKAVLQSACCVLRRHLPTGSRENSP